MQTIRAKVSVSNPDSRLPLRLHGLIGATDLRLKKQGGACVGVVNSATVSLEVRCIEVDEIGGLLQVFTEALAREGYMASATVFEAANASDPTVLQACRYRVGEPARSTQKLLFDLPPGYWIVSNLCGGDGRPMFAEAVLHSRDRLSQWKRIRKLRCDGRQCYIFDAKINAEAHINRLGMLWHP